MNDQQWCAKSAVVRDISLNEYGGSGLFERHTFPIQYVEINVEVLEGGDLAPTSMLGGKYILTVGGGSIEAYLVSCDARCDCQLVQELSSIEAKFVATVVSGNMFFVTLNIDNETFNMFAGASGTMTLKPIGSQQ